MATIAENLQTIIDIKADIKTAIENKGVTVGDAGFGEYASKIDSIETKSAEIILPYPISIGCSGMGMETFGTWTWPSNIKLDARRSYDYAFYGIRYAKNLPALTYSSGNRSFSYAFYSTRIDYLENIDFFNSLDFSNTYSMRSMFENSNIDNLNQYHMYIDTTSTAFDKMFYNARTIPGIIEFSDCSNIGYAAYISNAFVTYNNVSMISLRLPNLGAGVTSGSIWLNLSTITFTTAEACKNIIDDIAFLNSGVRGTITFSADNFNTIPNTSINYATAKGWTVESA